MNYNTARLFFDLLHGHPRETCPHCHKPRHRVKCPEWVRYDARMDAVPDVQEAAK